MFHLSFLVGEEPPIIYVQDVHIIIVECVDGFCGCHCAGQKERVESLKIPHVFDYIECIS